MRLTAILLAVALPLTATAQQQKPLTETLQSWFEKAKSYLPNNVAAPAPIASTAAKVASTNIVHLTNENWKSVLKPSTSDPFQGPETWMVFISGGNKTCYGRCAGVEQAWNKSASLLAADPSSPQLAYLNCDQQPVLCATWAAGPPSIWHIQIPVARADQSRPATTVRIIGLNTTTTTAINIIELHSQKKYEKRPVYEGALHPFNGWVAQYGLLTPLGYTLYVFANVPSWAFMIGISMFSRYYM
ncbi:MAG: hypothetical protein L6R41_006066 [Letrouitia leprolyta]|nr:MAG: hypothetical protein L6R41_006066 [Letrouitia leprolyta]